MGGGDKISEGGGGTELIISIQLFPNLGVLHFQIDYLCLCSIFGKMGMKFHFRRKWNKVLSLE